MLVDTTFIYALNDPETGLIRYIGKSNSPKIRLRKHLVDGRCKNSHRANWIKSLTARGLSPQLTIIDEVFVSEWPSAEAAYIEFFREQGCDLVNTTLGGEGASLFGEDNPNFGKPLPLETRRKISERRLALGIAGPWKGKKLPPETCVKLSIAASKKVGDKNHQFGKTGVLSPNFGRKNKNSSSAFYGISWCNTNGAWRALLLVRKKQKGLGYFTNEIEAAKAYDAAARIHHGKFAKLNFPD